MRTSARGVHEAAAGAMISGITSGRTAPIRGDEIGWLVRSGGAFRCVSSRIPNPLTKAHAVLAIRFWLLLAAMALLAGGATSLRADDDLILREAHAWGRFQKGSWRQVRILTENFDETGRPTDSSITHNTTTLEEVTPERVTLKVEVTVEVAGQRFPAPSQIVKQGYTGDTLGQTVSVKLLEPETLNVDGHTVHCQTRQVEVVGGVNREVSLISFCAIYSRPFCAAKPRCRMPPAKRPCKRRPAK